MYLDVHILHSTPFANLNRDDTGRPKEMQLGGVTRTRVSSQSWKRAIRLAVDKDLVRSRRVPQDIAARLQKDKGWDEKQALDTAKNLLTSLTSSGKSDKDVLLFLHKDQIDDLTALAGEVGPLSKKADKDVERRRDTIVDRADGTLAVFGRMFANAPHLDIDSALSVAHALSTHASYVEPDYFTAVDDLSEFAGDQGAGAQSGGLR